MRKKIKNINIPIKVELRNVTKEKVKQYGNFTYLYEFDIFINGKKGSYKGMVHAHTVAELIKQRQEEAIHRI